MGYRPSKWFHIEQTRKTFFKRVSVLLISILLLSAFLGTVTFSCIRLPLSNNRSGTMFNRFSTIQSILLC